MKVLHIVGGSLKGGAARGAYWLHQGLRKIGVDSKILVQRSDAKDNNIISLTSNKVTKLKQIILLNLDQSPIWPYKNRKRVILSTGFVGNNIFKTKEYKEADIIHLHWICGGMLSISQIGKIQKPIVWTMRDMWPMTGGCHYAMDCKRYETGCGFCKELDSQSKHDLSYFVLKKKRTSFPKNMKMVGISHWLSECAKRSFLFRDFDIRTIHNNVNTSDFFPIEKNIARDILGLPKSKKIIMTGAQNLKAFYKGFDKYLEAIRQLKDKRNLFLLFFGNLDESIIKQSGFEYKSLGFLHDTISLRLAYSASDVFVAPSLMDAFGKTLAESMCCGTPVVCFDATGPKDIVDHRINGYKATPYMVEDLAAGINWVLSDENRHKQLCIKAREKAVAYFDIEKVAGQYAELYREVLG
ncbi:MAG: glycosyltransferase family 4 protein [Deltaproteobacteria bacterium]|nr:glycosyltransferase family 4 protein [Deltaproteobacteria bacterium]